MLITRISNNLIHSRRPGGLVAWSQWRVESLCSTMPSIVEKLMVSPSVSYICVHRVPSLIKSPLFISAGGRPCPHPIYYTEKKTHFTAAYQRFQQSNNNIIIHGRSLIASATLIPIFFQTIRFYLIIDCMLHLIIDVLLWFPQTSPARSRRTISMVLEIALPNFTLSGLLLKKRKKCVIANN